MQLRSSKILKSYEVAQSEYKLCKIIRKVRKTRPSTKLQLDGNPLQFISELIIGVKS